jgi:hypothetical protein
MRNALFIYLVPVAMHSLCTFRGESEEGSTFKQLFKNVFVNKSLTHSQYLSKSYVHCTVLHMIFTLLFICRGRRL